MDSTWGGGLNLLDLKAPRQILEVISSQTGGGFPINFIGVLNYDPINEGIWIGANQGLYFYDPVKKEITAPLPDKAAENIHAVSVPLLIRRVNFGSVVWKGFISSICIPVPLKENSSTGT